MDFKKNTIFAKIFPQIVFLLERAEAGERVDREGAHNEYECTTPLLASGPEPKKQIDEHKEMEYQKLNEDHMLELKQKALEQREDWLSAAQEAAEADEKE